MSILLPLDAGSVYVHDLGLSMEWLKEPSSQEEFYTKYSPHEKLSEEYCLSSVLQIGDL